MKNGYLGIYDSGLGGITVVKAIQEALPRENIVFLADTLNMPYGNKTREQIVSYSLTNTKILSEYGLKAIIIACNTSDSLAREKLQETYDLPIIGVIDPAARKAALTSRNRRIAVLATQATTASGAYPEAISRYADDAKVISVACPRLVPLIEEGRGEEDELLSEALDEYLRPVKESQADTVILGCTHYDVLTEMIRKKLMPEIAIVSSSRCLVEDIRKLLDDTDMNSENKKGDRIYLATADPEGFREKASLIIDDIEVRQA